MGNEQTVMEENDEGMVDIKSEGRGYGQARIGEFDR